MMQWIKKISVLGLALFILSGGVGSAAPKKDDLQDILLYPRVGVLIFMGLLESDMEPFAK